MVAPENPPRKSASTALRLHPLRARGSSSLLQRSVAAERRQAASRAGTRGTWRTCRALLALPAPRDSRANFR
ncbi:rCG35357 [Rattus norvegicus]|uniref:RCG35357 n=1 Tax=Rattus norvegicus TaxID=10116 RepID=A6HI19_RAT|nr:rCG35357 [Rattus norvegicus]